MQAGSHFGSAVASYGRYVVVGAPDDAPDNAFVGGVVLVTDNEDFFSQKRRFLENPTPDIGDQFGAAVAVGAEVVVGGASFGIRSVLARIFTRFYQERANLLSAIVAKLLTGGRLERINRVADLQHAPAFRTACEIAARLKSTDP